MPRFTLTLVDTSGVQDYIFGSNRLAENFGASELVEQATREFLQQSLESAELLHNLDAGGRITQRHLERDSSLQAEVVLRGGGNALLMFRALDQAQKLVYTLTRLLIERAPGLVVTAAHCEFEWDTEPVGGATGAYQRLRSSLARAKQQSHAPSSVLGLGVTLECRSTGMPAVDFASIGDERFPASAEIISKLDKDVQEATTRRLTGLFDHVTAGYAFSRDFADLGGSTDDQSYVAVVHADGNGMGKRFESVVLRHHGAKDGNRGCLDALYQLSEAVDAAGRAALAAMVDRLVRSFREIPAKRGSVSHEEWLSFLDGLKQYWSRSAGGRPILPLRPIVFGGDDVTFVADGRLGLPLAAAYLEEWEAVAGKSKAILDADPSQSPTACAGVAIVKTHYPFARAYRLSAALCSEAKRYARTDDGGSVSALDWHFALSGITGSLGQIRAREYGVNEREPGMLMRPVSLRAPGPEDGWRTWPQFVELVAWSKGDRHNSWRRSKVKELREELRAGQDATRRFLLTYRLTLPEIDPRRPSLQLGGWDTRCGYFDPIEAMDFFLPITPGQTTRSAT